MQLNPALRTLTCFDCGAAHEPSHLQTTCRSCHLPLRADYDLEAIRFTPGDLAGRPHSLWRYREVLPIAPADAVSLVEGATPLVRIEDRIWIKDESRNPTGSFKARGMSVAVSMARALGVRALTAPSAGNAAGALAAYGAAARLPVVVAMPADTPRMFIEECEHFGAAVHLVPGTIADCGHFLRTEGPPGAFDVSTLREPYRVEGKKTMAYEIFEQMDGELPDVIVYPTGGGTGLVGMAKACAEMQRLGWIGAARPRFVAVQAAGCAPLVRAFLTGAARTEPWPDPVTQAYGLRVPSPIAGFICLKVLAATRGTAIAVPEAAIQPATSALAAATGLDICPETGAAWAAYRTLRGTRWIGAHERTVIFNTGTGLKYR